MLNCTDLEVTVSADGGQLMYHWTIDYQPEWEEIVFPTTDYYNLSSGVKDFNVATECVPEPTTMLLLFGGLGIVLGKRKRR